MLADRREERLDNAGGVLGALAVRTAAGLLAGRGVDVAGTGAEPAAAGRAWVAIWATTMSTTRNAPVNITAVAFASPLRVRR